MLKKKSNFYKRLNMRDGLIHPIHGQCWILNFVKGPKKGLPSDYRNARIAWEVIRGEIPSGLQVLHKCDNPPCVRPSHLFLGTISDNMKDAFQKGRKSLEGNQHALGHKQPESAKATKSLKGKASWKRKKENGVIDGNLKLTEAQVASVKLEYKRTSYLVSNARELAEKYGVGVTYISRIVSGDRRQCPR